MADQRKYQGGRGFERRSGLGAVKAMVSQSIIAKLSRTHIGGGGRYFPNARAQIEILVCESNGGASVMRGIHSVVDAARYARSFREA